MSGFYFLDCFLARWRLVPGFTEKRCVKRFLLELVKKGFCLSRIVWIMMVSRFEYSVTYLGLVCYLALHDKLYLVDYCGLQLLLGSH